MKITKLTLALLLGAINPCFSQGAIPEFVVAGDEDISSVITDNMSQFFIEGYGDKIGETVFIRNPRVSVFDGEKPEHMLQWNLFNVKWTPFFPEKEIDIGVTYTRKIVSSPNGDYYNFVLGGFEFPNLIEMWNSNFNAINNISDAEKLFKTYSFVTGVDVSQGVVVKEDLVYKLTLQADLSETLDSMIHELKVDENGTALSLEIVFPTVEE